MCDLKFEKFYLLIMLNDNIWTNNLESHYVNTVRTVEKKFKLVENKKDLSNITKDNKRT